MLPKQSSEDEDCLSPALYSHYRKMVGYSMYLAVSSRPNIMFAAAMLARQVYYPCISHLGLAKRVLRYLKGSNNLRLCFPSDISTQLKAYCGADWAGCRETRKCTT